MNLKDKVLKYKNEMISNLSNIISYKSILDISEEDAPYGKENARCLNFFLEMAKDYGFTTRNLDGHCGFVEYGEGDKIVGVLTHLDVVPAGNGWTTDPFKATIKDNKIYGRGTSDDKGAAIASLTALKIIKDNNIPLNKRIRLIVGCNEENGSNCMKYYVEKEGNIDLGFTPDGDFPIVHGEKGQIKLLFKCKNSLSFNINGGVVDNALSDNCKIEIENTLYDKVSFENYLNNNNIKYSILRIGSKDIIEVFGVSAHASTPEFGKNAISYMIMGLKESGFKHDLIDFYSKYIGLDIDGNLMGLKCNDEYGNLTFVNGRIWTANDEIVGTIDIRVPVTLQTKDIVNKINLKQYKKAKIEVIKYNNSLFYPIDSDIVKTLMKVYQEVTGDLESKPIVLGGGTYAKTMNNCLAFGCAFPNTNNQIHNANEFVDIDELLLQVELYTNAILELSKL